MAETQPDFVLNIYSKDDLTTVVATGDPTTGVAIDGLEGGTEVAAGTYVAQSHDNNGVYADSDTVPVPAFTVLPKPKAPAPASLVATPTADGANITATITA